MITQNKRKFRQGEERILRKESGKKKKKKKGEIKIGPLSDRLDRLFFCIIFQFNKSFI
jgi:hypothetical protein